jgi:hypothetical protein
MGHIDVSGLAGIQQLNLGAFNSAARLRLESHEEFLRAKGYENIVGKRYRAINAVEQPASDEEIIDFIAEHGGKLHKMLGTTLGIGLIGSGCTEDAFARTAPNSGGVAGNATVVVVCSNIYR